MNPRLKPVLVILAILAAFGIGAALMRVNGGEKSEGAKPPAPASVVKEADLIVLTLTPEAEKRLDLTTAPVERKKVRRTRMFGGEVTVPPGRGVVVSAPVAGTVTLPSAPPPTTQPAGPATSPSAASTTGPATAPTTAPTTAAAARAAGPTAGQVVEKGQAVFALQPLLTAEARTQMAASLVDAEGQVNSADVQLKAAAVALERATQLVADQAGSQRALDEARAQHEVAQKLLEAARARREILARTLQGEEVGSVPPIIVASPTAGVLRDVRVAAGQTVSSATPLFELLDISRVWVRVPVYAGDAADAAPGQPAEVTRLGSAVRRGATEKHAWSWTAVPVEAPPSGNPLTSTVDLFYEVDNSGKDLRPGERVSVTVPLRGEEESLVVPWSAVTFDVHGGAWVYEVIRPHAYTRRHVQVLFVDNGQAVLAAGPAGGTTIVTQGVAEMFGREMGFAK